ncbi:MAG: type II toxin-antitoxin system RelE/ParE family toxin [Candidatus Sedimenticola sp. (ex Thyasira tokunagai)]
MKYRLTKRARRQLDHITYYIAIDNERAAERVYESVLDTCQMIADMPGIGRKPTYLSDSDILSVNVKQYKNYMVFYRERREEVVILYIIDGRRNLPDLISDNEESYD